MSHDNRESDKESMQEEIAYHAHKRWAIGMLATIGGSCLALRYLFDHSSWGQTAVVYLAVPFLVGLLLMAFRPPRKGQRLRTRYAYLLLDGLIVMLVTSAFLFEGFICVLMFMPIYFAAVLLSFWVEAVVKRGDAGRGRINVFVLPALVLAASLEGTTQELSFERDNRVSSSRLVNLSVAQIKAKLSQPIAVDASKQGLLSLFVMPTRIEAGSLAPGDVHRIHYEYCRWLVSNCHVGSMSLQIASVTDNRITTRIVHDDSYISHYLDFRGTEIQFEPQADESTRVTLSVSFSRRLDPSWYFTPLQRIAVKQMAAHLIDQLIVR